VRTYVNDTVRKSAAWPTRGRWLWWSAAEYHLQGADWYKSYIAAMYWACMTVTTIGYGDIVRTAARRACVSSRPACARDSLAAPPARTMRRPL
jgi:hypothetical protein